MVRCCGEAGVPLVAYGGGTALEGHATTPFGGVSLNMKLMNVRLRMRPFPVSS